MDEIQRNHTEAPYVMQEGRVSRLTNSKPIVLNSGEANAIAAYLFDELKLFKRLHLTLEPALKSSKRALMTGHPP